MDDGTSIQTESVWQALAGPPESLIKAWPVNCARLPSSVYPDFRIQQSVFRVRTRLPKSGQTQEERFPSQEESKDIDRLQKKLFESATVNSFNWAHLSKHSGLMNPGLSLFKQNIVEQRAKRSTKIINGDRLLRFKLRILQAECQEDQNWKFIRPLLKSRSLT